MKLFHKIAVTTLGFVMATAVGAGVARYNHIDIRAAKAVEVNAASCDFKLKSANSTSYANEWTYGDFKVLGGANNNGGWAYAKFGAGKAKGATEDKITNGYVKTTTAISDAIKKVELVLLASSVGASSATVTWSLDVASDSAFTQNLITIDKGTISHRTAGSFYVTPSSGTDFGANKYYRLNINVTNTTQTNGVLWVESINFIKDVEEQTLTGLAIDDVKLYPAGSKAITVSPIPNGAVLPDDLQFSVANTSIATYSNGVVTALKSGNTTMTVSSSSKSVSTTVDITVNAFSSSGIATGKKYIITGAANGTGSMVNYELTGVNTGLSTPIGTAASYVSIPNKTYELTVADGAYDNTFAFKDSENKYLSIVDGKNALTLSDNIDALSSFEVKPNNNSTGYLICAVLGYGTSANRYLSFNEAVNEGVANPRFACYANTNQVAPNFYEVTNIPLTDFTIDETLTVYKTHSETVSVVYTPVNAGDKTLSWTSLNTSVATVDQNGTVTGVAAGTATIKASKTINEVLVERSCTVTVLGNTATHKGTQASPYTPEEAVLIAQGIYEEDGEGDPVVTSGAYVKGIITKAVSRTTSALSFWIGSNLDQDTTEEGAFEIYKAASYKGTAIGTFYSDNDQVVEDYAVGYTVLASGNITLYKGTAEFEQGGAIAFNNYVEARLFAAGFNQVIGAICDEDGNTDPSDLDTKWTLEKGYYNALDQLSKDLFVEVAAGGDEGGTAIEQCVAKYDYILMKYNTTVVETYEDFMGRVTAGKIVLNSESNSINNIYDVKNNSTMIVVVVVSIASISLAGFFLVLRKRKEQ